MTRYEAVATIYKIINSNIIAEELEEDLRCIANCICEDNFDKCKDMGFITRYCDGCKFFEENSTPLDD